MAHFAELDENNRVLRVIVVNNSNLLDANGVEREYRGAAFCAQLLGGTWVQTSYSGSFRKRFAAEGFVFDELLDAFIPPKPHGDGWSLNSETLDWELLHPQKNSETEPD